MSSSSPGMLIARATGPDARSTISCTFGRFLRGGSGASASTCESFCTATDPERRGDVILGAGPSSTGLLSRSGWRNRGHRRHRRGRRESTRAVPGPVSRTGPLSTSGTADGTPLADASRTLISTATARGIDIGWRWNRDLGQAELFAPREELQDHITARGRDAHELDAHPERRLWYAAGSCAFECFTRPRPVMTTLSSARRSSNFTSAPTG